MPSSVGRYQLLQTIGEGGMGVVYKAFDPLLERTLAIKLISARLDESPDLRRRFFSEARAAGRLSHKNIVTIYDLGEENGQPYFAMELLEGRNLGMRMHSPARMSLERKLDIVRQVGEGLAYAHARGIVHRDVKPANIFIIGSGQIKILDFGLARLPNSDLTRSRTLLGTFNYMAPEQINGEPIDHRADIFALGVVMYELLAERLPFKGESAGSVLHKILKEDPEPLEKVNPQLPRALCAIVNRAIAKPREDRYSDFGEMLIDLAGSHAEVQSAEAATIAHVPHPRAADEVDQEPGSARLPQRQPSSATRRRSVHPESQRGTRSSWAKIRVRPVRIGLAAVLLLAVGIGFAAVRLRPSPIASPATSPVARRTDKTASARPADAQRGGHAPGSPQQPVTPAAATSGEERHVEGTSGQTQHPAPTTAGGMRERDLQGRQSADAALSRMQAARRGAEAARASELAPRSYANARGNEDRARQLMLARRFDVASQQLQQAAALFGSAEAEARTAQARIDDEERQQASARDRAGAERGAFLEVRSRAIRAAVDRLAPAGFHRAEQRAADAQASFDRGNWADAARGFESATTLLDDAQRLARAAPQPGNSGEAIATLPSKPPAAEASDSSQSAERGIREALGRYVGAFESRNIGALKRLWPGLSGAQERAIRDEFDHASSIAVALSDPHIELAGSTATVTCNRRYQLQTDDGRRLQTDTRTTLTLRRSDAGWLIDHVHYEAPR